MPEPSKTGTPISRSRNDYPAYALRGMCTVLLSTGRNEVLGELFDRSRYQLPSGRIVVVKTLSQMERCANRSSAG